MTQTTESLPLRSPEPYQDLRVSFDPEHLARIFPFVAVGDIRYYLNGIHVARAPEGVFLVATNGHAIAVIHDRAGSINGAENVTVRVTRQLLAAAGAAQRKSNRSFGYRVLVKGQRLMLAVDTGSDVSDLELYVQPGKCVVEGKFPQWHKVLPDWPKLQRGALAGPHAVNPRYLAYFERIAHEKHPGILFWHEPGDGRVIVQLEAVPEMVAVIMPMRGSPDEAMRDALPKVPTRSHVGAVWEPMKMVAADAAASNDAAPKAAAA